MRPARPVFQPSKAVTVIGAGRRTGPVRSGTGSTGAVRNRAEFGVLALLGASCAACLFVSGLHVRGLGACGVSQFANLLPEIGGGLHKSGRDAGIGSCFCASFRSPAQELLLVP
jgi:hypothetical protein